MRDFYTPKHSVTNILKDAMNINNNSKVMLFFVPKMFHSQILQKPLRRLHECRKLNQEDELFI